MPIGLKKNNNKAVIKCTKYLNNGLSETLSSQNPIIAKGKQSKAE